MAKTKNVLETLPNYGFTSSLNTSGACRKAMGSFQYLKLLEGYEGRIFDEDVAIEMYVEIISSRISVPIHDVFKAYRKNKSMFYTNEEIYARLVEMYGSDVDKAVFERVGSYFIGHNNLGLSIVKNGKTMRLTKTGRMIVDSLRADEEQTKAICKGVLLNAMCKYPQNAFDAKKLKRKVANNKVVFPFMLSVLQKVGYISKVDIPILSAWPTSNADACAKVILERRDKGYTVSGNIMFMINLIDMNSDSVFKFEETKREESEKNIIEAFTRNWFDFYETTNLVKVIGKGDSIKIILNEEEEELIKYVIHQYSNSALNYNSYTEQFNALQVLDSYFFEK